MLDDEPYYQPTKQYSNKEYWENYLKEHGVEATIVHANKMRAGPAAFAEVAINNYLKMLGFSRDERQIAQHKETLEIAEKANDLACDSNTLSRWAIGISFISAVMAIWVAVATNQ